MDTNYPASFLKAINNDTNSVCFYLSFRIFSMNIFLYVNEKGKKKNGEKESFKSSPG